MDAASALLTSARGQIDAALSTLAASLAFLASDAILEPLRATEAPPAPAKPRARSRRRATPAAVVEPVVKPEPVAPVVDQPAAFAPPSLQGLEQLAMDWLRALGAGPQVARRIAEAATGTGKIAAHRPIYAALESLAARGLIVKVGRTYSLPVASA